jgi:hypothetical protein
LINVTSVEIRMTRKDIIKGFGWGRTIDVDHEAVWWLDGSDGEGE